MKSRLLITLPLCNIVYGVLRRRHFNRSDELHYLRLVTSCVLSGATDELGANAVRRQERRRHERLQRDSGNVRVSLHSASKRRVDQIEVHRCISTIVISRRTGARRRRPERERTLKLYALCSTDRTTPRSSAFSVGGDGQNGPPDGGRERHHRTFRTSDVD